MTAQTILPANTLSSAYDVDNSLRLSYADDPHLNHGTGTATNTDKATLSFWVKRSANLGDGQGVFAEDTDGNDKFVLLFGGDDQIDIYQETAGTVDINLVTNREFRDTSAWYHIVLAYDSSQGTAANRVKLYINGVQETSFSTSVYPASNVDFRYNKNNITQEIGRYEGGNSFDGYLSEIVFIDGLQLAPTSFGQFNNSGIWQPKDVSGLTFGNSGFYLEFKGSGTSANASGIGADTSGNTSHFTVTNLAATDQSTDTCTNNFATLNPLIYESRDNTFAEGNLKITGGGGNDWVNHYGVSNFAVSSGKWFVEAKITTAVGSQGMLGIMGTSTALGGSLRDFGPANIDAGGRISGGGGDHQTGLTNFANGNIAGAAFDATNGTIQFYRNGSAYGNAVSSIASDTYYFVTNSYEAGAVVEFNFGSPPYAESGGNSDADGHGNFSMAVPSGYFALNTKNLAEYG